MTAPLGVRDLLRWMIISPEYIKYNPHVFFRILGNQFALSGECSYEYEKRKCKVEYEGFTAWLGRKIVFDDLFFYLTSTSALQLDYKRMLFEMCQNVYISSPPKDLNPGPLLALLDKGIPVTIIHIVKKHCVILTFNKKECIYVNKNNRGLNLYRISRDVKRETLLALMQNQPPSFFPTDDNPDSALVELLGLNFEREIKHQCQKSGNCIFASTRLSLRSALILLGIEELQAKHFHDEFIYFSRLTWLEMLFIFISRFTIYTPKFFIKNFIKIRSINGTKIFPCILQKKLTIF